MCNYKFILHAHCYIDSREELLYQRYYPCIRFAIWLQFCEVLELNIHLVCITWQFLLHILYVCHKIAFNCVLKQGCSEFDVEICELNLWLVTESEFWFIVLCLLKTCTNLWVLWSLSCTLEIWVNIIAHYRNILILWNICMLHLYLDLNRTLGFWWYFVHLFLLYWWFTYIDIWDLSLVE